jgi:parallel beta-helix repeat protein
MGSVSAINTTSIETQSRGNILYVGGSGGGNYTRIQDAIDNASDGDTVFVYNDSSPYYENLIVDKSISLIGEDRDTTVINPEWSDTIIYVSSDNVVVEKFTIQDGFTGIDLDGSNCVINNCNIRNNDMWGIILRTHNTASNNTINNNGFGGINEGGNNHIISNTIKFNTEFGIGVSSNTIIENNLFIANGEDYPNSSLACDIFLVGNNASIIQNTFDNKAIRNMSSAIKSEQICKNNIISENKFFNYTYNVIQINKGQYNIISNNTFQYNKEATILLWECLGNRIQNNLFVDNDNGIGLVFTFRTNINKNTFINNTNNAGFGLSFFNTWEGNFWDEPRTQPYPIFGGLNLGIIFTIPWVNFDWHPAQEPYNIGETV